MKRKYNFASGKGFDDLPPLSPKVSPIPEESGEIDRKRGWNYGGQFMIQVDGFAVKVFEAGR